MCVISVRSFGVGVLARVVVEDALHAVLGHEDGLGVHLDGAQRGGGVRGEERVARARGEDDDAPLLQVAHRAAADVRLGHLGDGQGALQAHDDAHLLQRVLQRAAR
jgi:hypothetical protein